MNRAFNRWLPGARWAVIAIPFAWLLLFFAIPFAITLKISFASSAIAMPPYTDLLSWEGDKLSVHLNIGNYLFLLRDSLYVNAYLSSLKTALISTAICLLIGYPMAYAISRMEPATRNIALMLVVLPSWTSFLIRIYAWIGILKGNGLANNFLQWLGVIDQPLEMLHTPFAVYIGIVYAYLPFMILPLYSNMVKLDRRLEEAAYDLGAKPWRVFVSVTLPLTKAGIIAGSMLVLIPVVGEFVIPELLGGPSTLMIGKVLWDEFFNNRDWPVAAAVSTVMLLLLVVPITIFHHFQAKELERQLS
ncbi:MAG: ABC transporter permease subunit [Xanthomonadaceae bacterium]|nr:ABC transporter permease subunit [Xanthomonadaceae bacterium]MDP2184186.1 ABC transporter permease subunit [Xanthomonadales bacterium]MDZ4114731.1 ABC transporter permease subunit [Xanthomonadaceae bacterium]MDZ4377331.1 ABC transporter permease subunit [Xanthomonadaceae bacterium]